MVAVAKKNLNVQPFLANDLNFPFQCNFPIPKVNSVGIYIASGASPVRMPDIYQEKAKESPNDSWQIDTVLKFGDRYRITDFRNDWLKVVSLEDGTEGWIESHKHFPVDNLSEDELTSKIYPRVRRETVCVPVKQFSYEQMAVKIPTGSQLTYYNVEDGTFLGPEGKIYRVKDTSSIVPIEGFAPSTQTLKIILHENLGKPYIWGFNDCSSEIQSIFSCFNLLIPRNSSKQASYFQDEHKLFKDISINDVKTGDLIFFKKLGGVNVNHVGIALRFDKNTVGIYHHKNTTRIQILNSEFVGPRSLNGKELFGVGRIERFWRE